MKNSIFVWVLFITIGCTDSATDNSKPVITTTNTAEKIDLNRENVKPEAVQQYEQKVKNDLNDWYFRVKLFETEKRFTYRLTLQYEEVDGEDLIAFPNLGADPQPVIKKGASDFECIIGFLDQKGDFREYKKVHLVNGNLKITTLKSYGISVKPTE